MEVLYAIEAHDYVQWCLLTAVFVALAIVIDHSGIMRPRDAPPLVRGVIPWIGVFYDFWKNPMEFLRAQRKIHGDVFAIRMNGYENIIVFDPNFASKLLQARESTMSLMGALQDKGFLFLLAGEDPIKLTTIGQSFVIRLQHDIRRKFSPRLPKLTPIFEEVLRDHMQEVTDPSGSGVWESRSLMRAIIGRMTVRGMLGPLAVEKEIVENMFDLISLTDVADRRTAFEWPLAFLRSRRHHARFRRLITPTIEKRMAWKRANPTGWQQEHGLRDLLSMYVDDYLDKDCVKREKMSEETIIYLLRVGCVGALFAALGNTWATVEGTLSYILSDRNLYKDVCNDIANSYRNLKQYGCESSATDKLSASSILSTASIVEESVQERAAARKAAARFPILDACFKEYLRLNTGISMSRKIKEKPVKLPSGFKAYRGSMVSILHGDIMQNPKTFPEPAKFNPYRVFEQPFRDGEKSKQFLIFGNGIHRCPGEVMAQNEVRIAIGQMLRMYDLELEMDEEPVAGILRATVTQIKRSLTIRYRKRKIPLGESLESGLSAQNAV